MLRRPLVTGGAGFIGSNLIRRLVTRADVEHILSVDNYSSGTEKNHVDSDKISYLRANTWDIGQTTDVVEFQPTIIFHLGEYSRIVQSFDEPTETVKSNALGTFVVTKFASDFGIKLVYSGSTAILGNGGADSHMNPYAWTKSNNVRLMHNMKRWFGLEFAICYFYNVFGPGQITSGPYATVVGIFEHQFARGQELTIVSLG